MLCTDQSQIKTDSQRMTSIHVKSKAAHTGGRVNESIVQVLENLTVVKVLRIDDDEWMFARRGADWDGEDERLSLEFVKAMAWRVGVDAESYIVMVDMGSEKLVIGDDGALEMAVEFCSEGSGRLVLEVVGIEDVDEY